jgi:hypothetical protein
LGDLEWAYLRVVLAERMHWTLDYVDSLSQDDVATMLAVFDGIGRHRDMKRGKK